MKEKVFRITEYQLKEIENKLFQADASNLYVPIYCGGAYSNIFEGCERIIFTVHKIFEVCNCDNFVTLYTPEAYNCIFARSYESLNAIKKMGIKPKLWATFSDNKLQIYQENFEPVSVSCIVGSHIDFLFNNIEPMLEEESDFYQRTKQTFGVGTINYLSNLTVGVVGASGTGSIVAEQLVRLGVKRVVLVDDDVVEERNLGRILNSSQKDVDECILKTDMLKAAYERMGFNTEIISVPTVVGNSDTIHILSTCDILFGCLDSADGRYHLNRISTFYNIPYIDMGVKLVSENGNIEEISGAIRYIVPGCSSLLSRGAITEERLRSDALRRDNPEEYQKRLAEKYIEGASESSPAVISINMQIASLAVLEFLSRIHSYREIENDTVETVYVDLMNYVMRVEEPSTPDNALVKYVGKGDYSPMLGLPTIGRSK